MKKFFGKFTGKIRNLLQLGHVKYSKYLLLLYVRAYLEKYSMDLYIVC